MSSATNSAPKKSILLLAGEGGLQGGTERQFRTLHQLLSEKGIPSIYVTIFPEKTLLARDGRPSRGTQISLFQIKRASRLGRLIQYASAPAALRSLLQSYEPTSVFSAAPQTNLLSWWAAGRKYRSQLTWGARTSRAFSTMANQLPFRVGARVSRMIPALISNSEAGVDFYRQSGYRPQKWELIPNVIDTDTFAPREAGRVRMRKDLGIPDGAPLIGIVARLNPIKDHETFLRAAAQVGAVHTAAHFVIVGSGPPQRLATLQELASALGIQDKIQWLGARNDIPEIISAMDILTLTSRAEGFPNVIAEALACGTPCVSTDVGSAREILGPECNPPAPGDHTGIAHEILSALNTAGHDSQELRSSIVRRYSAEAVLPRLLAALRFDSTTRLSRE